ncbi:MAG: hypothetical protein ABIR18_01275 [Chitinophagaceae bacterium]
MRLVKFVAYLFYRYYGGVRRPNDVPYFRAMCTMTFLVFLHVLQLLILFNKVNLIPGISSDDKLTRKAFLFLMLLPIYLIMTLLIKEKELEKIKEEYDYKWDQVFTANVWLFVYVVLSLCLTGFLAYVQKK